MDAFVGTWRNKRISEGSLEAVLDAIQATDEQRKKYPTDREYEVTIVKGETDKMLQFKLLEVDSSKVIHFEIVLDQLTEQLDLDGKIRKIFTTQEGKNLREKYMNDEGEFFNVRSINARGNMTTTTSFQDTFFTHEWEKCC